MAITVVKIIQTEFRPARPFATQAGGPRRPHVVTMTAWRGAGRLCFSKRDRGRATERLSAPRSFFKQGAVYVKPPASLPDKTTSLMQPDGSSVAEARTSDELHFCGGVAYDTRIDNAQAEPLLPRIEWNRPWSRPRVPRREKVLLVT
jgi:hypothetical protein